MIPFTLLAPAKLNLFLEITGTLPNGYHSLCSLVDPITLYDRIELAPASSFAVSFEGQWDIPPDNSVTKTLRLLESFTSSRGKKNRYAIHIFKNIPPGSGMGGASSDAAALLLFFNHAWKLGLHKRQLFSLGAAIGADVPLFLHGKQCVMTGKGEIIRPLRKNFQLSYLLFVPPFEVSTKMVYESLPKTAQSDLTIAIGRITMLVRFLCQNDLAEAKKWMANRLEEPSLRLNPTIATARTLLQNELKTRFFLTGTGGALFSPFPADKSIPVYHPASLRTWKRYVVTSDRGGIAKEEAYNGNH